MRIRKITDRKPRILLVQGSPRDIDSCADMTSKSELLVDFLVDRWSNVVDFDVLDLKPGKVTIRPCKGCVSSSGGMHCHWKCSCFSKDMEVPDLMYEEDVYTRLEECDGFMIVSPIHWYAVSTQVKAMFDRLVCCNLTITKDQALQIFGKGNIKNSELTGRAELSGKYKHLLKNHLEGKWAAFFVHGDDGANDYGGGGPNIGDRGWDVKNCVLPLVYQCRFSGINCPDELVEAIYVNKGIPYHEANLRENGELYVAIDGLMERMVNFMENF